MIAVYSDFRVNLELKINLHTIILMELSTPFSSDSPPPLFIQVGRVCDPTNIPILGMKPVAINWYLWYEIAFWNKNLLIGFVMVTS